MKRLSGVLIITLIIAAVTLVIGLGPAASQQPQTETFTLCAQEKSGFDRFIDVGREGFSPGDYSVSVKPLFDPDTGAREGTSVSKFTFVRPLGKENGRGYVDGTYELQNGKVTFYSSFKFSDETVPFAVTGGNESYANVAGTVTDSPGRCLEKKGGILQFEITHNG